MVNSNANALGILFPNSYDSLVPDLVGERLMASIPSGFGPRMGPDPQERRTEPGSAFCRKNSQDL